LRNESLYLIPVRPLLVTFEAATARHSGKEAAGESN
jgi:hypothetical protein